MERTERNSIWTKGELLEVLREVGSRPSCLDMGWEWDVKTVYDENGNVFGHLLRSSFQRPDTDTGTIGRGWGRWWPIEVGTSVSGAIKTAWLARQQNIDHESMESFTWKGMRPFDPHAEIDDLCELNEAHRPARGER